MLDELKLIHERDQQNALGIAEKGWQQYRHIFNFKWRPPREIHNVVVAGMGGSGLAAKVFQSCPGLNIPLTIIQDYNLPRHVNQNTLLICSSYSGNTEEVLSVFKHSQSSNLPPKVRLMIITISHGGQLSELTKKHKLPLIELPISPSPREGFGYQLRALFEVFEQAGLLSGGIQQLTQASKFIKTAAESWIPTIPTKNNQAKQIAQELMGRSVVVYSGPQLYPAAYKCKIDINENAKQIAW